MFKVLAFGFILRLIVIAYSEWHDAHLLVKYTDIDYVVFTDAARFVYEGLSPFMRATYRYTPVLAYIMTPNIFLHASFGKVMFAVFDLAVSWIVFDMLRMRGVSEKKSTWFMCAYLFNPIVFNISTRGNADALVALLTCIVLHRLFKKKTVQAAIWFGLAVHVKIYPIIYALPFVLFLNDDYRLGRASSAAVAASAASAGRRSESSGGGGLISKAIAFLNKDRLTFGLVSGSVFLALTGFFYHLYGFEFLYETYLYHFVRADNRHNFSAYFYYIYLKQGVAAQAVATAASRVMGVLAFLPQFLVVIVIGIRFYRDIAFCVFLQTLAFVAFNKVCTVQYFVWYFALMPLFLPASKLLHSSGKRIYGVVLLAVWFITQGLWLGTAYKLEFLGENTFLQVWIAGLLFFLSNIWIVCEFIRNQRVQAVFSRGRVVPFDEAPKLE